MKKEFNNAHFITVKENRIQLKKTHIQYVCNETDFTKEENYYFFQIPIASFRKFHIVFLSDI